MKKKLQRILTGALAAALILALAGCGGSASQEAAPEESGEDTLEEYRSDNGWAVRYDPNLISVQEDSDGTVNFVFQGGPEDAADSSMASVGWVADKQPEEVLYEITSAWGADDTEIVRSEGFLPGTDDQWGFWRVLNASAEGGAPARTAIAGEYNGGVILLQNAICLTGDEEIDMAATGALETIADSITYEDFQPQTMYSYVPGTYVAEQEGDISEITLKEDHTGVLRMQDDIDILWGSIELMAEDGSFTYEYTVEGDSILVNIDGQWLPFTK